MKQYRVRYENDKGQSKTCCKGYNKKDAVRIARWLIENKVWVEVREISPVIETIQVWPKSRL